MRAVVKGMLRGGSPFGARLATVKVKSARGHVIWLRAKQQRNMLCMWRRRGRA